MSKNTGKNNKKINLSINVNSSLLFFGAKFRLKENMHSNIFLLEKITRVDQINLKNTIFTTR